MLAADVRGLRPVLIRGNPHRSPRLPKREEMRKENQCRKWIAISEADSGGSSCAPRRLSTIHFGVFVALSFSPDSARVWCGAVNFELRLGHLLAIGFDRHLFFFFLVFITVTL
jgi:hypothetical protein